MDPAAFDYLAGGACDECTVADNCAAFRRIFVRPRILTDVARRDPASTVLGTRVSLPVLLAPTALHRLAHPDGELATARAAAAAGTVFVVSTLSTYSLEDVAAVGGPLWFQLYVFRDRNVVRDLVARAEDAGYGAIVLTVDTPMLGRRERDVRNRFALPPGIEPQNFAPRPARPDGPATAAAYESFAHYVHDRFDESLSWRDVEWLRSLTPLPLVLKGVLTAEDARRSVAAGADALIVSNHGGRQLDGVLPTIFALADVSEAVGGRIEVLMDGGVRRGTDVLKALALGARAVLIGRPYLWGLAAEGEAGVRGVLELLRAEIDVAMALSGCPTLASIDRSLVAIDRQATELRSALDDA
jgi:4-hydroxymandelate oxidase